MTRIAVEVPEGDTWSLGEMAQDALTRHMTAWGWSVLPLGRTRVGNALVTGRPAYLRTPVGNVVACDLAVSREQDAAFVEVKTKRPLDAYPDDFGLDRNSDPFCDGWHQLCDQNRHMGPALLAIHDQGAGDMDRAAAWSVASVQRIICLGEPRPTKSGTTWLLPKRWFIPLCTFLGNGLRAMSHARSPLEIVASAGQGSHPRMDEW